MDNQVHNQIVSFIWGIADDCLRDVYVRGKYRDVILPMTVIRRLDAMLEGGKSGVEIGAAIIPGVLIICSLVMMLSGGPAEDGTFTGAAYEGVGFLPWVGEKLNFILKPLFGFALPHIIRKRRE